MFHSFENFREDIKDFYNDLIKENEEKSTISFIVNLMFVSAFYDRKFDKIDLFVLKNLFEETSKFYEKISLDDSIKLSNGNLNDVLWILNNNPFDNDDCIIGDVYQILMNQKKRNELGTYYTSKEDILKVLNPLFMDEFNERFNNYTSDEELKNLQKELTSLYIFDPACGCGNFLLTSYDCLKELNDKICDIIGTKDRISIQQFYGIEIDDSSKEICEVSLMLKTKYDKPNILCGNSLKINWEDFCKKNNNKIFIVGNPPYAGKSNKTQEQKDDMDFVFGKLKGRKSLDYVSCWFMKASNYIDSKNISCAFVSTNSITQGEQLSILWKNVLNDKLEISFARRSFKWMSSLKKTACVTCVIIGLSFIDEEKIKKIYDKEKIIETKKINPSLSEENYDLVKGKSHQMNPDLPTMTSGNKPVSKYLILSKKEKDLMISSDERSKKFIKKFVGARDMISKNIRYCLWIEDEDKEEALAIKSIKDRLEKVKEERCLNKSTKNNPLFIERYHSFFGKSHKKGKCIIIPSVISENRYRLIIDVCDDDTIVSDANRTIYTNDLFILPILVSRIHYLWVLEVCGKLETSLRYSVKLCYNTFPIGKITENDKIKLRELAEKLLAIRDRYKEVKYSELYNIGKTPKDLQEIHEEIDECVESLYRPYIFKDEKDKIRHLHELYEK